MRSTIHSWNSFLTKLGFSRRKRRRPNQRSGFTRSLRLEKLEGRQMLTIITVDIPYDEIDGDISNGHDVSLRDAVILSNPGDTIKFAPSLTTITLNRDENNLFVDLGELQIIGKDLTIDGGPSGITIEAYDPTPGVRDGQGHRIFNIVDNSEPSGSDPPVVELKNLTLTGADVSGNGGAIFSNGLLRISDCTIQGNKADAFGGGIVLVVAAYGPAGPRNVLTIERSVIDNNVADSGGGVAVGAGSNSVNSEDSILIIDTMVSNNNAVLYGGGGIYAELRSADLVIADSELTDQ